MKINHLLLLLIPFCLTSCAVYRQKFDCPPDPGVPCTSVSDLEQMIIETPIGPDLFLGVDPQQNQIQKASTSNHIWISDPTGNGYYIYLEKRCYTH